MEPRFPNLQFFGLLQEVIEGIASLPISFIGLSRIKETMAELSRPLDENERLLLEAIAEHVEQEGSAAQQITLTRLLELYGQIFPSHSILRNQHSRFAIRLRRASLKAVTANTDLGKITALRRFVKKTELNLPEPKFQTDKNTTLIISHNDKMYVVIGQNDEHNEGFNLHLMLRLLLEELGLFHQHITIHEEIRFTGSSRQNVSGQLYTGYSVAPLDSTVWLPLITPHLIKGKYVFQNVLAINHDLPPEILRPAFRSLQVIAQTLNRLGLVMDEWSKIRVNRYTGEISLDIDNVPTDLLYDGNLIQTLQFPRTARDIAAMTNDPNYRYFPNLLAYFHSYESDDSQYMDSENQLVAILNLLRKAARVKKASIDTLAEMASRDFIYLAVLKFKSSPFIEELKHPQNTNTLTQIIRTYLLHFRDRGLTAFLVLALPHILDRFTPDMWLEVAAHEIERADTSTQHEITEYWEDVFDPNFEMGELLQFRRIGKKDGGNSGSASGSTPSGSSNSPPPTDTTPPQSSSPSIEGFYYTESNWVEEDIQDASTLGYYVPVSQRTALYASSMYLPEWSCVSTMGNGWTPQVFSLPQNQMFMGMGIMTNLPAMRPATPIWTP